NDTDQVAQGGGTMGSRSLQAGGLAVHQASIELVDQARHLAADLLEANPDDVQLDTTRGEFYVVGTPTASRSWTQLATAAEKPDGQPGLRVELSSQPGSPTFPFGAHVAVVEVDTGTGGVRLLRIVTVDDSGTIINPLLTEGQRHGGLAQGIA